MRRLFTTKEAEKLGLSAKALECGVAAGRFRRAVRGVYAEGPEDVSRLDVGRATVLATGGVAAGALGGVLLGLDSVDLDDTEVIVAGGRSSRRPGVRRRLLDPARVMEVGGVPCAGGLQVLIDLAATLDDLRWEQALESALRQGHVTIEEMEAVALVLGASRTPGAGRVRRVLAVRPPGAPATESLLETHAVQLVRRSLWVPTPRRQEEVFDEYGIFVARVDLSLPEQGVFFELDGQQHAGQPVYDANRETAIVAATGWLCGRLSWREVVHFPNSTLRRIERIVLQAMRRPLPPR